MLRNIVSNRADPVGPPQSQYGGAHVGHIVSDHVVVFGHDETTTYGKRRRLEEVKDIELTDATGTGTVEFTVDAAGDATIDVSGTKLTITDDLVVNGAFTYDQLSHGCTQEFHTQLLSANEYKLVYSYVKTATALFVINVKVVWRQLGSWKVGNIKYFGNADGTPGTTQMSIIDGDGFAQMIVVNIVQTDVNNGAIEIYSDGNFDNDVYSHACFDFEFTTVGADVTWTPLDTGTGAAVFPATPNLANSGQALMHATRLNSDSTLQLEIGLADIVEVDSLGLTMAAGKTITSADTELKLEVGDSNVVLGDTGVDGGSFDVSLDSGATFTMTGSELKFKNTLAGNQSSRLTLQADPMVVGTGFFVQGTSGLDLARFSFDNNTALIEAPASGNNITLLTGGAGEVKFKPGGTDVVSATTSGLSMEATKKVTQNAAPTTGDDLCNKTYVDSVSGVAIYTKLAALALTPAHGTTVVISDHLGSTKLHEYDSTLGKWFNRPQWARLSIGTDTVTPTSTLSTVTAIGDWEHVNFWDGFAGVAPPSASTTFLYNVVPDFVFSTYNDTDASANQACGLTYNGPAAYAEIDFGCSATGGVAQLYLGVLVGQTGPTAGSAVDATDVVDHSVVHRKLAGTDVGYMESRCIVPITTGDKIIPVIQTESIETVDITFLTMRVTIM